MKHDFPSFKRDQRAPDRTKPRPRTWSRASRYFTSAQLIGAASVAAIAGWTLAPSRGSFDTVAATAPAAIPQRVYYSRCADARAAGAAPLYEGDPGYREALDADLDGVACETLR